MSVKKLNRADLLHFQFSPSKVHFLMCHQSRQLKSSKLAVPKVNSTASLVWASSAWGRRGRVEWIKQEIEKKDFSQPHLNHFLLCVFFLKQTSIKSLKVGKQILAQSRLFSELKAIFQTLQAEVFESCLPSTCNKFTVGGTYLQHACLYS